MIHHHTFTTVKNKMNAQVYTTMNQPEEQRSVRRTTSEMQAMLPLYCCSFFPIACSICSPAAMLFGVKGILGATFSVACLFLVWIITIHTYGFDGNPLSSIVMGAWMPLGLLTGDVAMKP